MAHASDTAFPPDEADPGATQGRYRFQVCPWLELEEDAAAPEGAVEEAFPEEEPASSPEPASPASPPQPSDAVPSSPKELVALQQARRREKPVRGPSAKVTQVMELVESLELSHLEEQQLAWTLVLKLERHHDEVVEELKADDEARHPQIVRWAVDADRLYRARLLLEWVEMG